MSIPASEAASYDAWAEVYDSSDADRAPFIELYRGLLQPGMDSLLELGCGTGTILAALATGVRDGVSGARIVGVDGSPGMAAVARRRDQSIDWRLRDLRDPGVEGRFDLVLCVFNTLQHLLGDEDLLAACVDAGVDTRLWYGSGAQANQWFSAAAADALEVTQCLDPRVIGLPMAPDLRPEQVERVVTAVARGLAAG